jgi:hypothetical protein
LSSHTTSPVPQQEYNPHIHATTSSSAYLVNPQQQNAITYSRPQSMLGDLSDAPWTHMHPHDPQIEYQHSFMEFTPSAVEQEPEPQQSTTASFQVIEFAADSKPKSKKLESKLNRRAKPISKPKPKSKPTEHSWEHHSIVQRGGVQLMTKPEQKPTQRSGIRRGKLDPDAAEKARKIRRMTACWNCWIQKVPVGLSYPFCDFLCGSRLLMCCAAVLSWEAV